jgi:guanylate kinase
LVEDFRAEGHMDYDTYGFPMDYQIIEFVKERFGTKTQNTILIAPSGSGKSTYFSSNCSEFIDEEVLMKLKWDLRDAHFSDGDLSGSWFKVCTSVVTRAVKEGLPVAMSPKMCILSGAQKIANQEGMKILCVLLPEEELYKRVKSRSEDRGIDVSQELIKAKLEYDAVNNIPNAIFCDSFDISPILYHCHPYCKHQDKFDFHNGRDIIKDPDTIRVWSFSKKLGLGHYSLSKE